MDSTAPEAVIDSRYVRACDLHLEEPELQPFCLVIFGGVGDLSQRKLLPTLSHLFGNRELVQNFSILGVGRQELDDASYRNFIRKALDKYSEEPVDNEAWNGFAGHVYYHSMDVQKDHGYAALRKKISGITIPDDEGNKNVIYYMAVPPLLTPIIVKMMKTHGLSGNAFAAKILVEKPFGRDRSSAVELNRILSDSFSDSRIYRIDHYLGKETLQNLIFFRFSNNIFEPLWNRRYIDNVQITVAESIGIEHRGAFYEQAGVVRDIVQNHIMQIIALVAMEPPVGFKADYVRDERVKVFRSFRPMDDSFIDEYTLQGQYGAGIVAGEEAIAYREEKNVAGDSVTPTFIAAKIYIDNWRWAEVPFYIRTGKRLAQRITNIVVQFKQPPLRLFGGSGDQLYPNILTLTIQPEEEISLKMGIKYPHENNKIYQADMKFNYNQNFGTKPHPAYERLILDCLKGDQTLFAREDGIDATWEMVDPMIKRWENNPNRNFPNYTAGTWGPAESDRLLEKEGRRWHTS
ncbi:MAG: glucose-6-phosphate dehydrogenase [Spirochaetes bacterium RBG_16_49_21]|nr:MAG: glucose-6-phosphate dehydrogenase [Spirochaetes bacterium RBG_16_49_21]